MTYRQQSKTKIEDEEDQQDPPTWKENRKIDLYIEGREEIRKTHDQKRGNKFKILGIMGLQNKKEDEGLLKSRYCKWERPQTDTSYGRLCSLTLVQWSCQCVDAAAVCV